MADHKYLNSLEGNIRALPSSSYFIEKGGIWQKLFIYSPVDFHLRNGWVQEWIRWFMWPIYSNRLQGFDFHLFHRQKIGKSCIHKDSLWSDIFSNMLDFESYFNGLILTFLLRTPLLKKRFQHQYKLQRKVKKYHQSWR